MWEYRAGCPTTNSAFRAVEAEIQVVFCGCFSYYFRALNERSSDPFRMILCPTRIQLK